MQKIMACLERPAKLDSTDWGSGISELLHSRSEEFQACHFMVEDQDVEEAAEIRLENTSHPKNAIVSVWLENAYGLDNFYAELEALGHFQAYSVVETSTKPFKQQTGRTPGFCQSCFLTKPNSLSRQQWLNLWLGEGSRVALKTQSSYSLVQSVATVPLPIGSDHTKPWHLLAGFAQDYFADEAMWSREAFYSAPGDTQKYLANEQELISSCLKYIDFDHFDCIPMSQYVIKACDW